MVCFLCAAGLPVFAAEITTLSGKRIRNAEVVAVESEHVILRHDAGRDRVSWSDLSPATQLELLKAKVLELEKLKGELSHTRDETKELKKTAEQYRQNLAAIGVESTPEKPVAPAAGLPALQKTDLVDAADLAGHFKQDVGTADARYRRKVFRLEGVVDRLEKDLFVSTYQALLRIPGKSVRVLCVVRPPEFYKKVYTIRNGERIVAEGERSGKVTLMQSGDKVLFEGRCSGINDNTVTFVVSRIVQ